MSVKVEDPDKKVAPKTIWPMDKNDYILERTIGSGATSLVHAAYCPKVGERVAIKRIDLEKRNVTIDEIQKEIQAMSMCNHENVATYFTAFVTRSELWIIMKLHDGGSVLDLQNTIISKNPTSTSFGVLDEPIIATIIREVLKGLVYIHQNAQIHRDLKSGNILLGMNGTVQIGDFGVSSTLCDYDERKDPCKRKTFVGTPCWMAPEVMERSKGYNHKVDIWSLGITALEMATGSAPYAKHPAMKVLKLTLQDPPPNLETYGDKEEGFKKYSKSFRKMVAECLQKDPKARPEAKVVLKHKFFKQAKNREYLEEFLKANAQSIDERSDTVSRVLESSGKMFKSPEGDWIWPEEDTENAELDEKGQQKQKPFCYNIMFRIRNKKGDMNEITFNFDTETDKCEGIAEELVMTNLIDGTDRVVVAANMKKLLTFNEVGKKLVFPINRNVNNQVATCESKLIGYAQLCLNNIDRKR